MVTKLEHAKSISIGMTIFNKRRGIVIPRVSAWWEFSRIEPKDDSFIVAMQPEISAQIYGEDIEILYSNVHDWQQLKAMHQIIDDPRLLSTYNYFKIAETQRLVTQQKFLGK